MPRATARKGGRPTLPGMVNHCRDRRGANVDSNSQDGFTPEQAALRMTGLYKFHRFDRVEEAISFFADSEALEDQKQHAGLVDQLKRARRTLINIEKELARPVELIRYLKINEDGLIDDASCSAWSTRNSIMRRPSKDGDSVKPISHWKLKDKLTAEQASLIISGLEQFSTFTEVREWLDWQSKLMSEYRPISAQHSALHDVHGDVTEPKDKILDLWEQGLDLWTASDKKTMFNNASAIKDAIAGTKKQPPSELMSKSNIYDWCKSNNIDLQHWIELFGDNLPNEGTLHGQNVTEAKPNRKREDGYRKTIGVLVKALADKTGPATGTPDNPNYNQLTQLLHQYTDNMTFLSDRAVRERLADGITALKE